jgi:hydroxyacylglutathione hydrolase
MFFEKIESPGLAHLSYVIGHKGQAAVIDPRRDVEIYLQIARKHNARITHIFETHRNEDYVIGSMPLAARTNATIHHGAELDFAYGSDVTEGDRFEIGDLELSILSTPGHTMESISVVVRDTATGSDPVGVFTGDALFVGDVGRTDFFPDRLEEVAGMLHDSIFEKLLPLGDHVLLWPAHGAGSVCGSGMAARDFSSLGLERKTNAALQVESRKQFIENKVSEHHYKPPYFEQMEEYNLKGNAPDPADPKTVAAMDVKSFAASASDGMVVVDTRSPAAIAGASIPGSLALPMPLVPAYAGWLLDYDQPIGLVVEDAGQVDTAVAHLQRLGYDNIAGYLEGLVGWAASGRSFEHFGSLHVDEIEQRVESGQAVILDVRKDEEVQAAPLAESVHIYLGHLPGNLDALDKGKTVVTFCGSGMRAVVAASILKRNGFQDVYNALGSVAAAKADSSSLVEA